MVILKERHDVQCTFRLQETALSNPSRAGY